MNKIFSYFIVTNNDDDEICRKKAGYASWFLNRFPEEEFEREDRVMYNILYSSSKLRVKLKQNFVNLYLKSDLKNVVAKKNIKIKDTESLMYGDLGQLSEAVSIISRSVYDDIEDLSQIEPNLDDFTCDMKEWMSSQLKRRLLSIYNEGHKRLQVLTEKQIGAEDALEYTYEETKKLKRMYSESGLEKLGDIKNNSEYRYLCKTGLLDVDEDLQGIYTTDVITYAAGPGVGKTSAVLGTAIYNAIVYDKINVAYIGLEQPKEQYESKLIARHIFELKGLVLDATKIAKKIYEKEERDEEIMELIAIARHDLFESGTYGKLYIRDNSERLYLEKLTDTFDEIQQLYGPFDVIAIDHMAIIKQDPSVFSKRLDVGGIVSEAYTEVKSYASANHIAFICINQLNRDGAKDAKNGKKVSDEGFAGGMETIRSSDYVLVFLQTEQMKSQGIIQAYTAKGRSANGIDKLTLKAVLKAGLVYKESKDRNLSA